MLKKIILFFLLLPVFCYAQTNLHWQTTSDAVANFQAFEKSLPSNSQVAIKWPQNLILLNTKKLYAYFKQTEPTRYIISFDNTADCHGVKTCSVGSIQAVIGANPQIYYSRDNAELTRRVLLNGAVPAYFTPGHAMADYWPPMISWHLDNVTYTLSWNLPDVSVDVQQTLMREMANNMTDVTM